MAFRTLIVDNTAIGRKILSESIASFPEFALIGTAANGEIALKKIAQLKPDLVFSDVHMPGMSGIEFLKILKVIIPKYRSSWSAPIFQAVRELRLKHYNRVQQILSANQQSPIIIKISDSCRSVSDQCSACWRSAAIPAIYQLHKPVYLLKYQNFPRTKYQLY